MAMAAIAVGTHTVAAECVTKLAAECVSPGQQMWAAGPQVT